MCGLTVVQGVRATPTQRDAVVDARSPLIRGLQLPGDRAKAYLARPGVALEHVDHPELLDRGRHEQRPVT